MGNLFNICSCQKKREEEKNNQSYTSYQGQDLHMEKSVLSHQNSQVPSNIIDVKIKKQNLIVKRKEDPFVHYINEKKIGEGAFGVVYKVSHKTSGIMRAMKQISKENICSSDRNSNEFINEINILRQLDHPNIMKIYEVFEDHDYYYIISEFCDQGNLAELMEQLGYLNEFLVKFMMHHIFNAVAYLHNNRIVHGDIKLENILLFSTVNTSETENFEQVGFASKQSDVVDELRNSIQKKYSIKTKNYLRNLTKYEIKMIDFGCSKFFHKKQLKGIIGTSVYCSPEVIGNYYREECDEWACGILMYILLAAEPPFQGKDEEELFKNIKKGNLAFKSQRFKKVSNECIDLIKKLLVSNPEKRITAKEALKHPFFTENVHIGELLTEEIDLELLNELRNTKINQSKFQEAILAYISLNFIDKDEEKRIKDLFRFINKQHTSFRISKEDFVKCLKENKVVLDEEEAETLFDSIDSDKNGSIEYQELICALSDKNRLLKEVNLREAFNFFDTDKSQAITWDEINSVIFAGKDVGDGLMNDFLKQIGKSKNDEINFEEFCWIMNNNNN